jgi:5-formyltetrahydrofolate cyclo-ligase
MPRRHDHDASGPADVLAAKAELRDEIWAAMSVKGIGRFPTPANRIPNFVGAEAAAARLAKTPEWQRAGTVKSNPDSPQLPVRVRALHDQKLLYMAVPRLAEPDPFFVLDPAHLSDAPRTAATIKGAGRSARTVGLDDMEPVDLVVTGCVAVGEDGRRLGKGGGFSDLELAVATAAGLISSRTVIATTVHDVQVVEAGRIPVTAHDFALDLIVTPTRVLRPRCSGRRKLARLDWSVLSEEKIGAIPLLASLRATASR